MSHSIEILFEDDDFLAVNKPAGLPTQLSVDKKRECLYEVLRPHYNYLGLHHRLDVPTSGVILLTKSERANKPLSDLFRERKITKEYLAICWKTPAQDKFQIENYLKEKKIAPGKKKMVAVHSGGDPAFTTFEVLERFSDQASLVKAFPRTGRMHQIRVHLSQLGHPILGDALYFRADRKYPRLMLHAYQLIFTHPFTNKKTVITCPAPSDFQAVLERLRRNSSGA